MKRIYACCIPIKQFTILGVTPIVVTAHDASHPSTYPHIFAGNEQNSPRLPSAVFEYKLDAIAGELLSCDNLQFIYTTSPERGMGQCPVVRRRLGGPVVVGTKSAGHYQGFPCQSKFLIEVIHRIFTGSHILTEAGADLYPSEVEIPTNLEARIRAAKP
jgi:hypothetical protein